MILSALSCRVALLLGACSVLLAVAGCDETGGMGKRPEARPPALAEKAKKRAAVLASEEKAAKRQAQADQMLDDLSAKRAKALTRVTTRTAIPKPAKATYVNGIPVAPSVAADIRAGRVPAASAADPAPAMGDGSAAARSAEFDADLMPDQTAVPLRSLTDPAAAGAGAIMILESDGSITTEKLGPSKGNAGAVATASADLSQIAAELAAPADQTGTGLGGSRQTAANAAAYSAFMRARGGSVLPPERKDLKVDPSVYQGATVRVVQSDPRGALVESIVKLQAGVDADTAFAYASCALAGWAKSKGVPYARHIRTIRSEQDNKVHLSSIYVTSGSQPQGLTIMTTGETLRECKSRKIPAA
ncbi:hypothetical protein [Paracoccus pacificus]|uniref:Lipoprotein n=1 Tax=Paracoccus pacificus TaxID=1463598 RepID=A0ABW4RC88_9RHOB